MHSALGTSSMTGRGHSARCPSGPQQCNRAPSVAPAVRQSARESRRHAVVVRAANDEYYSLLGVDKGADKKTIKTAYRQAARKFHPDVNKEPGAEDKFKRIGEAYEVLSDDNKRAIYDRYGEAGLKGQSAGFGSGGPGVEFTNPFDLFESFFGSGAMGGMSGMGGRPRSSAQPGEDERYELQLDFLEAVFGCSKEIEVDRLTTDPACEGTGVKAGTTPVPCSNCGGTGQYVNVVRTPLGTFQQVSICSRCNGTGNSYTPCDKCGGDGRIRETKRIAIKVPPGVDSGSRLRVRGEGNVGRRGGEAGDMYVYINVREHPEMRRDGNNIHSDAEVSFVDAILGTQIKVTTVDGPVELKIPAGTQPGTTLLMAKRGAPRLGNASVRGDHSVHIRVKIPKQLSGEERKLVEELKELQGAKAKVGGPFRL